MLTKRSWAKIAAIVALCVLLCTGVAGFGLGYAPFAPGCAWVPGAMMGAFADYDNVGDGAVDAAQVKAIDLHWAAGRVVFESSDAAAAEGQMVFEEDLTGSQDDRRRMRWELDDGVLRIAYCPAERALIGCTPFAGPGKTLTIAVPKGADAFLDTVSIDGLSGEYVLEGLQCGTLEVQLTSGRVSGSGVFEGLRMKMTSGNVSLAASVRETLSAEVVSGDFTLECLESMPREVALRMTSGTAALSVPDDAGFTATVDKVSGSFSCELPDVHRIDDAYVRGDGASTVRVDMTSGNATLRGNDA